MLMNITSLPLCIYPPIARCIWPYTHASHSPSFCSVFVLRTMGPTYLPEIPKASVIKYLGRVRIAESYPLSTLVDGIRF